MPTLLQEKEAQLNERRKALFEQLEAEQKKSTYNSAAWDEIRARIEELDSPGGLGKEVADLKFAEAKAAELKAAQEQYAAPSYPGFQPAAGDNPNRQQIEAKNLSDLVLGTSQYKSRSSQRGMFQVDTENFADVRETFRQAGYSVKRFLGLRDAFESKTLVSEGSSFSPPNPRTSVIVPMVFNVTNLLDFLPTQMTNLQIIKFMEGTTWTANAATAAEGATSTDSAYVWTERSDTVRKIIGWVPVTDEQLDDVPEMATILNQQLGREVRVKLQSECISGNNTGTELNGYLTRVTQTQAKGSDATPDALYKAMTLIRYTGRAEPDAMIMHPNDWQDIQLLKDQIGHYIWGDPSNPVTTPSIWGLPVIVNTDETQNTALIGAFRDYSTLYMREDLTVETGFVNDDFTKTQKTIRGVVRAALQVRRLNAFCTVTGI